MLVQRVLLENCCFYCYCCYCCFCFSLIAHSLRLHTATFNYNGKFAMIQIIGKILPQQSMAVIDGLFASVAGIFELLVSMRDRHIKGTYMHTSSTSRVSYNPLLLEFYQLHSTQSIPKTSFDFNIAFPKSYRRRWRCASLKIAHTMYRVSLKFNIHV